MISRKLLTLSAVAIAFGNGCQHSASAANPQTANPQAETTTQVPAPFASPPVLAGTPDVATLVAKVKPSVVNITTVQEVKVPHADFGFPGFEGLFPFGGGNQLPNGTMRRPHGPRGGQGGDDVMRQQALGSGFLIDSGGHVVTNAHVVEDADTVKVRLADDREFRAKVVGKDDRLDVAVLQLEGSPRDLPLAALGSSEALRVGEYVVAIGNPFGLGNTVTMGIVSAKGRTIGAGPYDDFIQTDASINPGNSGGPLFNLRGEVVGINTAINPQGKGIGFAIPIDATKGILPQLIATGHVSRGRLGVLIQGMDDDLAKALGLDHAHGALVEQVEPGSPAERAGIRSGDVIVAVDGQDVPHSEDLPRMVAPHKPGSHVKVTVERDRHSRDVDVPLAALEEQAQSEATGQQQGRSGNAPVAPGALGVGVADQDGKVVVQSVAPSSAATGKLHPGDVILEVNHQPLASASDLSTKVAAAKPDKPLLLRIKRGDQTRYIAIERNSGK
ncbi:MAG: Do family serine endopeptidase [Myxococcota bacterium]|nr:Do family serine endopeptidase [Myxococcota bacterium]